MRTTVLLSLVAVLIAVVVVMGAIGAQFENDESEQGETSTPVGVFITPD